jgi:hypothetical protein
MRIRSAFLLPFLFFLVLSACNGESEGQPCLVPSDCSGSLTCRTSPNYPKTDGMRCCPVDVHQATTADCMATQGSAFDAGSPAPPTEGGADATVEGGEDAPAESAADTGPAGDGADATPAADAADGTSPADAADGSSE